MTVTMCKILPDKLSSVILRDSVEPQHHPRLKLRADSLIQWTLRSKISQRRSKTSLHNSARQGKYETNHCSQIHLTS